MKKIILSVMGLSLPLLAFTQEKTDSSSIISQPNLDQEIMESVNQSQIVAPIIIVGLLIFLIVSVTKYILEHRLKNKIVSRGISEQLSATILEKNGKNKNDEAMKWAILLCGIAIGLTITYYTMPFHLHSLAIMALSISASYFAYFFYLKNQKKNFK